MWEQGTLLFLGLLLLLWVPLLIFSSGNPTYQACPSVLMPLHSSSSLLAVKLPAQHVLFEQGTAAHSQHLRQSGARAFPPQVPEVVAFGFNATLLAGGPAGGGGGAFLQQLSFPLFAAGERRAQAPWASRGPLPAGLQDAYVPSQLMLLCVSQARTGPSHAEQWSAAVAGYAWKRSLLIPVGLVGRACSIGQQGLCARCDTVHCSRAGSSP